MIVGRKPKLTPAQQTDLLAWNAQRNSLQTMKAKARELGVCEATLKRYIYGQQKCPVRV